MPVSGSNTNSLCDLDQLNLSGPQLSRLYNKGRMFALPTLQGCSEDRNAEWLRKSFVKHKEHVLRIKIL